MSLIFSYFSSSRGTPQDMSMDEVEVKLFAPQETDFINVKLAKKERRTIRDRSISLNHKLSKLNPTLAQKKEYPILEDDFPKALALYDLYTPRKNFPVLADIISLEDSKLSFDGSKFIELTRSLDIKGILDVRMASILVTTPYAFTGVWELTRSTILSALYEAFRTTSLDTGKFFSRIFNSCFQGMPQGRIISHFSVCKATQCLIIY